MPLKSATSRPGLTGRNRSQVRAIGVMRGSTTMILRPLLARLPDIVRGDRRALGDVGAADPDHVGAEDVATRDWPRDRCRTPSCCPPRRSPCRAGRCSRCSRSSDTRGRTCPSGRSSRWSGSRRRGSRTRLLPYARWMRSISAAVCWIASSYAIARKPPGELGSRLRRQCEQPIRMRTPADSV